MVSGKTKRSSQLIFCKNGLSILIFCSSKLLGLQTRLLTALSRDSQTTVNVCFQDPKPVLRLTATVSLKRSSNTLTQPVTCKGNIHVDDVYDLHSVQALDFIPLSLVLCCIETVTKPLRANSIFRKIENTSFSIYHQTLLCIYLRIFFKYLIDIGSLQ